MKGREGRVVLHIRPQLWFLKEVRGGVVLFFSAAFARELEKVRVLRISLETTQRFRFLEYPSIAERSFHSARLSSRDIA